MKLAILASAAATATAESVSWSVTDYSDIQVPDGETVTFTYSSSHDVYEFPDAAAFDSCDFKSATLLCDTRDSPCDVVASGTRFIGCSKGSHCKNGQEVKIVAATSKAMANETLSWSVRDYDDVTVPRGDYVTFEYSSSHDLWEFGSEEAFDACDFSDATLLGDRNDSPVEVQVYGTRRLGCSVGSHCRSGQKVKLGASDNKAAAKAVVGCPGSPAPVHCGGTIEATLEASCADVQSEVLGRIARENGWFDAHNNGSYSVLRQSEGFLELQRVTGDGKYTDLINMDFADDGAASCSVTSCSESQVFSVGDFSTNYCNQRLLLCGSAEGCRTAGLDAAYTEAKVTTLSAASTKASDCLAI